MDEEECVYLYGDMKPVRTPTDAQVPCPISGCGVHVPRQVGHFRRDDAYLCPDHTIYISPTTYDHRDPQDNLLRPDDDWPLIQALSQTKRETGRLGRERSEDTVTLNVFRGLERLGLLEEYLSRLAGEPVSSPRLMFWSYCPDHGKCWPQLMGAREEFERNPAHGSEPDLMVESDDHLFFVETKLGSENVTEPSNLAVLPKYESGGEGWYERVFRASARSLASGERLYELMRFWLLGSWIAQKLEKKFLLVVITRREANHDYADRFRGGIRQEADRRFVPGHWEDIPSWVSLESNPEPEAAELWRYLCEKTLGYRGDVLQRAFSV